MTPTLFRRRLFDWFAVHLRPMPWKGEKNPYFVWLSEIILQQTRVEQGLPYFERFVAQYPTVTDLANAPDDDVMKLWEGLGYYSRARNLLFTARQIAQEMDGKMPNTYAELLQLKGVGTYTAAAIASFAYDLPHAVVDGNVYRVLSRIFGIATPIDTPQAKTEFTALANDLLDPERAADFNQAMMDFGATHCLPARPLCSVCPFRDDCVALQTGKVSELPMKSKKLLKTTRIFHYLHIEMPDGSTFIRKRIEKDIWQDLYELPNIESDALWDKLDDAQIRANIADFLQTPQFTIQQISAPRKQLLTHRTVIGVFYEIKLLDRNFMPPQRDFLRLEAKNLVNFAFPKIIDLQFKQNVLTLF